MNQTEELDYLTRQWINAKSILESWLISGEYLNYEQDSHAVATNAEKRSYQDLAKSTSTKMPSQMSLDSLI